MQALRVGSFALAGPQSQALPTLWLLQALCCLGLAAFPGTSKLQALAVLCCSLRAPRLCFCSCVAWLLGLPVAC